MNSETTYSAAGQMATDADKVAQRAERLGARSASLAQRPRFDHLGAAMADAVLQAGVRYETVVYPRIVRIHRTYPHAKSLRGVEVVLENGEVSDFLQWTDATKVGRFTRLASFLRDHDVESTTCVVKAYQSPEFLLELRKLNGIGPKTIDYFGCLVGVDLIAIDRHIVTFAMEAGVQGVRYEYLREVFCSAAEQLGLERRSFDQWLWSRASERARGVRQGQLPV